MAGPNTISFGFSQMLGQATMGGSPGQTSFFIARVKSVLLDDSDVDKFNKLGGWRAIGTIECVPFINFNDSKTDPIIARPLNSNVTQYPLVNETVLVKVLISKQAQNSLGNYKPEFYYTDIISVWNAPEHNAVPDTSFFKENPNTTSVTGKFISNGDTKRLVKAPGDITVEGRRGGSIRMGSNTPGYKTPWTAATSKPVLVLSNNPFKTDSPARFEDVNKDGSIMVMMSGHNIGFVPASANFDSYNTKVSISEKQNVVVADQKPQAEATSSLVQQDAKPIPPEVPATGSLPVSSPVPPAVMTETQVDEEELPEREDLQEINVQVEVINVVNNEQQDVPDIASTYTNLLQNKSINNKNLGSKYYYPCSVYNQGDPIWAKNSSGNLTMKKYGCCYTSFSMLVTNKKSSSIYNPQWFWQNSSKEVMVYWQVMAKSVGLSGVLQKTRSIDTVDSVLTKGPLMFEWVNSLASGTKYTSYYTKGRQHWMVISGKNTDGTYTVLDPSGGKIRTNQPKEAIEAGLNTIYYFK